MARMPPSFGSVFTARHTRLARAALVMKLFEPLTT
jgi:hypothetical protein